MRHWNQTTRWNWPRGRRRDPKPVLLASPVAAIFAAPIAADFASEDYVVSTETVSIEGVDIEGDGEGLGAAGIAWDPLSSFYLP